MRFSWPMSSAHFLRDTPGTFPAPTCRQTYPAGFGKAAGSMVQAAENHYLNTLALPPSGLSAMPSRASACAETKSIPLIEAGHPWDAASVTAGERALALAQAAGPDDLVLVLLSGGASANWVAPAAGLSLADKQAVTRALLRSGAPIGEIKRRAQTSVAHQGDASQRPAMPRSLSRSRFRMCRATILRASVPARPCGYDDTGRCPRHSRRPSACPAGCVRARLEDPAMETPKPGHRPSPTASTASSPARRMRLRQQRRTRSGQDTSRSFSGPISPARPGRWRQRMPGLPSTWHARAGGRRSFSGGELTVTFTGDGRGGPNQEYAMALALALRGHPGIAALAGDTDAPTAAAAARMTPPARWFSLTRSPADRPWGSTQRAISPAMTRLASSHGWATC